MITCGMATLKVREELFKKTIESIYPHADKIIAVLNYYDTIPDWLQKLPKVECVLAQNELGDAGKFLKVSECDGYYFSLDDDLFYPHTFISDMIAKIEQYDCVVTLHGKRYDNRPISSFRKGFTTNIHCLHTCLEDTEVHVGGSGAMAFYTTRLKVSIDDFPIPNMADIWISKLASEQGVKIMAVAHKAGYLRYMSPDVNSTIWRTSKDRDPSMTSILNSFLK